MSFAATSVLPGHSDFTAEISPMIAAASASRAWRNNKPPETPMIAPGNTVDPLADGYPRGAEPVSVAIPPPPAKFAESPANSISPQQKIKVISPLSIIIDNSTFQVFRLSVQTCRTGVLCAPIQQIIEA